MCSISGRRFRAFTIEDGRCRMEQNPRPFVAHEIIEKTGITHAGYCPFLQPPHGARPALLRLAAEKIT